MIGYIKGKVIANSDNVILLENGGIGYEITCSVSAFSKMMQDREGGLFTYLQLKEDGISLYGFASQEEKSMFLKLISVSGVGAKMGITVLGGMSLKDLALAIATSDVKSLSKIKGLGKKTAERIIVELRESVSSVGDKSEGLESFAQSATIGNDGENAVLALISLGYNRSVAVKAVSGAIATGANAVEEIIAVALRSLG
ncbi:MAG: Holliday junction branch migration protein RuvA [Clostridia bacterium]|nr:Holliday junction branch migration protein RuvA [Clostridia bacterium]